MLTIMVLFYLFCRASAPLSTARTSRRCFCFDEASRIFADLIFALSLLLTMGTKLLAQSADTSREDDAREFPFRLVPPGRR